MKGPAIWTTAIISIFISLVLIFVFALKNPKKARSKGSINGYLIATSGIIISFFNQFPFMKEYLSPFAPEFLQSLRRFSMTRTYTFLREFYQNFLTFVILMDCFNRYILICLPHLKTEFLTFTTLIMSLVSVLVVSSVLAGLASTAEELTFRIYHKYYKLFLRERSAGEFFKNPWLYDIILKVIVSVLISLTLTFFTFKICAALKKSVNFLLNSNAGVVAVKRYKKISHFSKVICFLLISYDLIVSKILLGFEVRRNLIATGFIGHYSFYSADGSVYRREEIIAFTEMILGILIGLKPGFYGLAYIWVKVF